MKKIKAMRFISLVLWRMGGHQPYQTLQCKVCTLSSVVKGGSRHVRPENTKDKLSTTLGITLGVSLVALGL